MIIKPIRNIGDLQDAKGQLAELLTANASGQHDDAIEVLSTLIETFENTHSRVNVPTPIAAVRFRMEELGLSPRQLEPFIGSRARVSEVLSGKRHLSIDMIRALHEGLGIPYEALISERPRSTRVENVGAPTLEKLNTLGFCLERSALPSFVSSSLSHRAPALLRKTRTQRASSKTDQAALLLWQAAVRQKSETIKPRAAFYHSKFSRFDLRELAKTSAKVDGPRRVISELGDHGISVVILPPLPGTFLDGAAMVSATGIPVIGLTLRHDRLDTFWFTLLHEACHIALHYDYLLQSNATFIDDIDIQSDDARERKADDLARNSLIPARFLSEVGWGPAITQDHIVSIATRARVHAAIVAGRWQREHHNYKKFSRLIERGKLRAVLLPAAS